MVFSGRGTPGNWKEKRKHYVIAFEILCEETGLPLTRLL